MAMGVFATFTIVNAPSDVGLEVEDDGKTLDKNSSKDSKTGDRSSATVWDLVTSPFLWLVSFSYLVVFCAKTSAVDWGQLYLMEDLKHSQYYGR